MVITYGNIHNIALPVQTVYISSSFHVMTQDKRHRARYYPLLSVIYNEHVREDSA